MKSTTLEIASKIRQTLKISVSKEYLIYDFIGMIGSVGGTIGMFIGFSFFDVIGRLSTYLKTVIMSYK